MSPAEASLLPITQLYPQVAFLPGDSASPRRINRAFSLFVHKVQCWIQWNVAHHQYPLCRNCTECHSWKILLRGKENSIATFIWSLFHCSLPSRWRGSQEKSILCDTVSLGSILNAALSVTCYTEALHQLQSQAFPAIRIIISLLQRTTGCKNSVFIQHWLSIMALF